LATTFNDPLLETFLNLPQVRSLSDKHRSVGQAREKMPVMMLKMIEDGLVSL
jgi:hypothetical protein